MTDINSARILILATDGYERSELRVPLEELRKKGADVKIASLKPGEIKSWDEKDWGDSVSVDLTIADVKPEDFHALVIPGGQINPDVLRADEGAVNLVRAFVKSGKPVAAICHGPWLLVEADALKGRKATSFQSIRTDMKNAGAQWEDKEVVVDEGIITSRSPKDLQAFVAKIIEEVGEGRHERHAA
ncbi:type 1 glutamine amidotransferase domain-containing protein [Rhizobium sp. SSA_523]|uniref:type 1 glutamine amidotransferase domain-containing protein n=1 Tax=Rhizobium sp. SSA_523 TaxID=2952477 RepID=UPI0020907C48|nr:type 1 glutamine amidotransferase domain-containing protein [Rhizobium sp. SSA_523]MCO5731722.1 type 1 glutamine amidotransferase [Rhizobium sp. SSA_523]WKC22905.1 type 1 glutamine amidotransferase domain-containing protein [Rhizobium sp. SSA_523]